MNRIIFMSVLLLNVLTMGAAYGEDPREISSIDYALSDNNNNSKTLKITQCRISHVSTTGALCNISVGNAGAGDISLKVDKLDKNELKAAIFKCAGLKGLESPDCDASIVGKALPKGAKPQFQVTNIIWSKN